MAPMNLTLFAGFFLEADSLEQAVLIINKSLSKIDYWLKIYGLGNIKDNKKTLLFNTLMEVE